MVTAGQVNHLIGFKSKDFPVVSLYLNTDLRHTTLPAIRIAAKDLIKQREKELEEQTLSHSQKESLKNDFSKILTFVEEELSPDIFRGHAIFSCSGENFWQVYPLPQKVKNALIIDPDTYVRPLIAILNQYRRFCLLFVDRRRARLFEYFMGQISPLPEVDDREVPSRVRLAGWYGLEEKRVVRHIDYHVHLHYKRVADILFRLHTRQKFDYFVLGGKPEVLSDFERHLHRYIQDRIVERVDMEPPSPEINPIRELAMSVEQRVMRDRLSRMVDELITDAGKKNRAVLGLENVLKAANMGNIRMLMIEEDAVFPGRECFSCGYLSRQAEVCPVCGAKTSPMNDLYDEIVENTVNFNGEFYQVPSGTPLGNFDGIGAFLRFDFPEE